MRLEASVIKPKEKEEVCQLGKEERSKSNNKSKRSKKKQKKSMPSRRKTSVVQKLFQICKEVFANCEADTIPPPRDVERLKLVLDSMKPADVGLTEGMDYFKIMSGEAPSVTYLHLYECNKFSIGIFCLPNSGVIPLHNHPGMTVFSKLLFGSMHIKSYDWVTELPSSSNQNINPSHSQPSGVRLAKVKTDSTFTAPCNTSILYPASGGNMHCFTAVTPCAVLDVLGPPYSDPEGRHCTYYKEFPYTSFSGDDGFVAENEKEEYAWLEAKDKPDDFSVDGAMYRGPKIVEI